MQRFPRNDPLGHFPQEDASKPLNELPERRQRQVSQTIGSGSQPGFEKPGDQSCLVRIVISTAKTVLPADGRHPRLELKPGGRRRFFTVSPVQGRPKENGVRPPTSSRNSNLQSRSVSSSNCHPESQAVLVCESGSDIESSIWRAKPYPTRTSRSVAHPGNMLTLARYAAKVLCL